MGLMMGSFRDFNSLQGVIGGPGRFGFMKKEAKNLMRLSFEGL
jgi:hypothetical protein